MSIDSNDLRDALKPQDGLAALITVLGIAIAIFLDDSVVKLIGGCIAVLGGIAFYMTIQSRINDQVRIKKKRTTLPPPSFKTRVTTDPKTSARRIRFDDFQETFHVDEDDADGQERTTAPPAPARTRPSAPAAAPAPTRTGGSAVRFDDFDDVPEVDDTHEYDPTEPEPIEGEGFRIVGAKAVAQPAAERKSVQQQERRADRDGVSAAPQGRRTSGDADGTGTPRPTETVESGDEDSGGKRRKKKKRGGKRGQKGGASEAETPAATPQQKEPPRTGGVSGVRPVTSTATGAVTGAAPAPARSAATVVDSSDGAVRRQIQMVLDELSLDADEEPIENEPRAEFVRLVNQVLKAIARSIEGRSIIFFWVNLERKHFIPEAFVTQGDLRVRLGERIRLGNDLVSQIATGGVPEIITNISKAAENELVPYYSGGVGTSSFVGVPVYFRHEVVGVLAADAAEESSFDEGSVATLAEYTLLISQLIRGYTEKFDLYLMRQGVEAFENLHTSLTGASLKPNQLAGLLADNIVAMFDADYVGVILYDKEAADWSVAACRAESDVLRQKISEVTPDMRNSIAGEAARRAEEIYLANVGNEMCIGPSEPPNRNGSFLAVPLMAATKCYGSLVLGNASADAYVPRDIDLMRDLARYVAMAIEVVNTNDALEEQLVFDEETGLYNSDFFLAGLDREIERAQDFKSPLAFAMIRVEAPTNFAPNRAGEISRIAVSEVGALLARKLRPYDLLGRYGSETFSVALVGRSDQEAYLWAERLRKEIAGHIIPFDGRTFSVTVSSGVCDATGSSDRSKIVGGARQALDRAVSDGGNAVVIY